ncbi:MAG: hypothetical protein QMD80_03605 [archaeon]|nr:hypothetical protein [archaeon]
MPNEIFVIAAVLLVFAVVGALVRICFLIPGKGERWNTKSIATWFAIVALLTASFFVCLDLSESKEEREIRTALDQMYINKLLLVDVKSVVYDKEEETAQIRLITAGDIILSRPSEYKKLVGEAVFDAVPELKSFTCVVEMAVPGGYRYYKFSWDREDFL